MDEEPSIAAKSPSQKSYLPSGAHSDILDFLPRSRPALPEWLRERGL